MKRIVSLLLIITVCVLFVGCSKSLPKLESDSATQAPAASTEAVSVTQAPIPTETVAPTEKPKDKIEISEKRLKYVSPFHEGLAWVEDTDSIYKVVDREGYVYYKVPKKSVIIKTYPFSGGLAYYKISNDPAVVIDNKGNEIYTEINTDDVDEKVLGVGAGRIFIRRNIHNFDDKVSKIGALDSNGKDVGEFFESANTPSEVVNCGDGLFVYGSYSYYSEDSRPYKYDINTNTETKISCDLPQQDFMGSRYWCLDTSVSKGYLYDLNDNKLIKEIEYDPEQVYSSSKAVYDDQAVINGTYYDLNGNVIADIKIDKKYLPFFYPLSDDGYAPVVMSGEDGDRYYTFYDKNGNRQFDPVRISNSSDFIASRNFIATVDDDSDMISIIGHDGSVKKTIPAVDGLNFYDSDAFEDYIISYQYVYYFLDLSEIKN